MGWVKKQQKLARMRRLPIEIRQEVEKAVSKSAEITTEHVRFAAPEDDGHLKDSVRFEEDFAPEKVGAKIIAGDKKAFYARMVEFGTVHQKAQAFFYPAIRAEIKRNRSRISRAARKGIKRALAKKGR